MDIETKEIIERLQALGDNPMLHETAQTCTGCIDNFSQQVGNNIFRRFIIDLLERSDPDTHVKLPMDADGEYIHIGDEVYAKYGNGNYFNGEVHSIEFTKNAVFAYCVNDAENDGDEFVASNLHHGSHIRTVRQILGDFAYKAFDLGVISERKREAYCSATLKERDNIIKACAMELAPLLSEDAETGYEADKNDDE